MEETEQPVTAVSVLRQYYEHAAQQVEGEEGVAKGLYSMTARAEATQRAVFALAQMIDGTPPADVRTRDTFALWQQDVEASEPQE